MLDFLDNPTINWKAIVLGLTIGSNLFDFYLNYREYLITKKKSPPKALAAQTTEESFKKSQTYTGEKLHFGFIRDTFSFAKTLITIKYDLLSVMWNFGGSIMKSCTFLPSMFGGQITQSCFTLVVGSFLSTIIDAPFSYYSNFVLEEKFGFNKMTPSLWIKDQLKVFLLSSVLSSTIISGLLKIIEIYGKSFIIYACGFVLVVQLGLMTIYPIWIAPLFNKFSPLEDGELKTAIDNLAAEQKFPLTYVYVVDGSTRSAHSNAYFTGLPWSKRIVLYDTLLKHSTVEETVAVLAHEIGHWKKSHLPQQLLFSEAEMLLTFTMLTSFLFNKSLFSAFGFTSERPVFIGLLLYSYVSTPIDHLSALLFNMFSRSCEYEADQFALENGYKEHLGKSLIKLHSENSSMLEHDWLYSTFNHSHPSLSERLEALNFICEEKIIKQE